MTDETIEPSLAESRSREDGIYLIETERVGDQDRYMIWDVGREHYYPGFYLSKSAAIAAIKELRSAAVEATEWDDLRGRAPNCTGDLSSEAFVRQQRDSWPDPTGGVTSPDYVMDKDTDAKLFAAALYVISGMWGNEMGDLQRASLANQIVREIERRGIVMPAAAAEPPSSGDGANTDYVMVPRKASDEMVEQARMTLPGIVDICDADIEDIYETMIAAAPPSPRSEMREALEAARQFIVNGVELGYIHIPKNDPAEHTLRKINAALKEA